MFEELWAGPADADEAAVVPPAAFAPAASGPGNRRGAVHNAAWVARIVNGRLNSQVHTWKAQTTKIAVAAKPSFSKHAARVTVG